MIAEGEGEGSEGWETDTGRIVETGVVLRKVSAGVG